ncbi:MAG: 16S rRNA (cytidine(1402)-2'-O)-methyltransferase [Firmicutes bacterium]|nr:16S rRNA (cytidine(1402)-2'-O)-methyltransferase [Bacillota bacterium]
MNAEYRERNKEQGEPGATGTLYLVTTPIGNLEDLTPRAARILKEVDLIAAEDTRQTRKLLAHLGIQQRLISYYREREQERAELLLEFLADGENIAVVSDAGTPGLSDPGAVLVAKAVAVGIQVVPIPGVSACLAALVASGLPTHRFVFEGFLPRKPKEKKERLVALADEERTIVLYEAPHRLTETLGLLAEQLGPERPVVIARELTKKFEEFWRGSLAEAVRVWSARDVRGEFTLVLAGRPPAVREEADAAAYDRFCQEVRQRCATGEKASAVIREIAQRENISRSSLYQYYQKQKSKGE